MLFFGTLYAIITLIHQLGFAIASGFQALRCYAFVGMDKYVQLSNYRFIYVHSGSASQSTVKPIWLTSAIGYLLIRSLRLFLKEVSGLITFSK